MMRMTSGNMGLGPAFFSAAVAFTLSMPVAGQELEEIVVTARKKEESLQDIPVSVTAFNTQLIEDLDLRSPEDLARFTPGLSFDNAFGRVVDRPAIRGVTTILNGVAGANAAATFIDGVYIGGSISTAEFSNLERVEVIKGPQSALYGRATYGGAINYVTKAPTDDYEGQVKLNVGQHDTTDISLSHSGPIIEDSLYYFVAYSHFEYGGEYNNVLTGEDVGDQETDSFTVKLQWTPTETIDATLRLGLEETDDGHFAIALQPRTENNCCFRTQTSPRSREYYVGEVLEFDEVRLNTSVFDGLGGAGDRRNRVFGSLKVDWDIGDLTLTSITGYVEDDTESRQDVSYGGYDPFEPFVSFPFPLASLASSFLRATKEDQQDISQELLIRSNADNAFRWNAGAYFYHGEEEETQNLKVWYPGNFFGIPGGTTAPNGNLGLDEIDNVAVFGGIEFDINEQLTVTGELRWAEDDVTVTNRGQDLVQIPGQEFNEAFDSVTGRVTATYRLSDNHTFYGNVATGNKPGTFNGNVPLDAGGNPDESFRNVDEENITQFEAGWKYGDGRTSLNMAAYFSMVDDAQFTQTFETPTGGSASLVQNIGETEILGFEFDITSQITDSWFVQGTYSYTDSEITKYVNEDQADLLGSDGSTAQREQLGDVSGQQTPRIPRTQLSLFSRYERPINRSLDWFFSVDGTLESSKFAQVHNLAETGDRTYVGARIGIQGENWDVSIWGRNLTDDQTPIDILRYIDRQQGGLPNFSAFINGGSNPSSSPRGFAVTLPRGRQVGLNANFRF